MKRKRKRLRNRILVAVFACLLPLCSILPSVGNVVKAEESGVETAGGSSSADAGTNVEESDSSGGDGTGSEESGSATESEAETVQIVFTVPEAGEDGSGEVKNIILSWTETTTEEDGNGTSKVNTADILSGNPTFDQKSNSYTFTVGSIEENNVYNYTIVRVGYAVYKGEIEASAITETTGTGKSYSVDIGALLMSSIPDIEVSANGNGTVEIPDSDSSRTIDIKVDTGDQKLSIKSSDYPEENGCSYEWKLTSEENGEQVTDYVGFVDDSNESGTETCSANGEGSSQTIKAKQAFGDTENIKLTLSLKYGDVVLKETAYTVTASKYETTVALQSVDPNEGTDQNAVILTSVLAATGGDAVVKDWTGTFQYEMNADKTGGYPDESWVKIGFSAEPDLSQTGYSDSFTYSPENENLLGEYKFRVTYVGDSDVKYGSVGPSGPLSSGEYLQNKTIAFNEEECRENGAVIEGEGNNLSVSLTLTDDEKEYENRILIEGQQETPDGSAVLDSVGRKLVYSSNNPDVVTVSDNGSITVKKAGTAYITIQALRNGTYYVDSNTLMYTITVQHVIDFSNESTIVQSGISWTDSENQKVYDGKTDITLSAVLEDGDDGTAFLYGYEDIRFTIEAEAASADVALDDDKTVIPQGARIKTEDSTPSITVKATTKASGESKEIDVTKYFAFRNYGKTVADVVTITRRPVYVKATDVEIEYGQSYDDLSAFLSGQDLVVLVNGNGQKAVETGEEEDASGFLDDYGTDIVTYPIAKFQNEFDATAINVGDKPIILPDLEWSEDGNAYTTGSENYEFQILEGALDESEDPEAEATVILQIITAADLLNAVELSEDTTSVYWNTRIGDWTGGLWVKSGTTLTMQVKEDSAYSGYYDTVEISFDDGATWEVMTGEGQGHYYETEKGTETVESLIRLRKKGTDTYTVIERGSGDAEEEFADFNCISIDSKAPALTYNGLTNASKTAQGWLSGITFGIFKKLTYHETVTVYDNTKDEEASGIATISYYVWNFGTLDGISDKEVQAVADKLAGNTEMDSEEQEEYEWTPIDLTDEANYTIPVASSEGDYLVFTKIVDKVGNGEIYVSNGMIFDADAPVIELTSETAGNGNGFYNGDIKYGFTVNDVNGNGYFSGLANIEVTVNNSGSRTEGSYSNGTFVDSAAVDLDGGNLKFTAAELGHVKTLSYEGNQITSAKNNSNQVTLTITATDHAGNTLTELQKTYKIDVTKPTVSVSYDNNSAQNSKYFKKNRTMTVAVQERNFDKADSLTFDVKAAADISGIQADTGVKVSDLSKYGISAEWVSDTQSGKTAETYTDERVTTLKLTFHQDNEYYVALHCTDLADNSADAPDGVTYAKNTMAAKEFVIDKTAPVLTVGYAAGGQALDVTTESGKTKRTYSGKTVTATLTVEEKNFRLSATKFSAQPQQIDLTVTASENPQKIPDYQSQLNNASDWSCVTTTATTSMIFDQDANYSIKFVYTDLAGNQAVYAKHYFTVDQTKPDGTISIDEPDADQTIFAKVLKALTFHIFRNDVYKVTMTSGDTTSGVLSVKYYKAAQALTESEVKALTGKQWKTYKRTFTVAPDEQFVLYGRIEDRAGNVRYLYPKTGIVSDDTKPAITITERNREDSRNNIYNKNVKLHISVTDPEKGKTYSGLESVYYTVEASGNVTEKAEDNTFVLLDNSGRRVQGTQDKEYDITINAGKYNSSAVAVTVHAIDFSGNETVKKKELEIDTTAPEIQVVYDLNAPANEVYYNAVRTATVTVTERDFDVDNASDITWNITNTDGTQPAISSWSHSSNAGVSDEATYTCTITYAADGDYTFSASCRDKAGNESVVTATDLFTIDQTEPVIEVTYSNSNVANGKYYSEPQTAVITVTEHNFDGAAVEAAISASLQSQGITAPGIGGWSDSGDTHTASITFEDDGDYRLDVNYSDLAGNEAAAYTGEEFTVDQTPPEVTIFDIENESANNGTVAPGVSYSDVNYDASGVVITYRGVNHPEQDVDGTRTAIENGQSIKMDDFAHTADVDDVYTMTAVVTDLAGNASEEQTVMFSVNRFGSNYVFSDDTKEFLDGYYSNEEQDLVVTEYNVDTLVHNGISYGLDGELVELVEGTDYSIRESGGAGSWKTYEYTINASNFEKEGVYSVTIDSEDAASNIMNNKIKEADIDFVIDKTAPSVVITGVEDNKQYTASTYGIEITTADNVAMSEVRLYTDKDESKPAEEYSSDEIVESGGTLSHTLESSGKWQYLKAVAVDAAGNTADTSGQSVKNEGWIGVYVNASRVSVFLHNRMAVTTLIIVAAAIVAILILAGAKRRKKEEE